MYYEGPSERKEFYLSILLDRAKGQNVVMYSTEGGVNIEDVAHNTPEKIFKEWVHPAGGLQAFQARKIAFNFGLSGDAFKNCVSLSPIYIMHMLVWIVPCLRSIRCSKQLMIRSLQLIAK